MSPAPLTIGDTNRAGDLQIIDTNWDSNGTLRVTVEGPGPRTLQLEQRMRRLARRAITDPEKTRSSRILHTRFNPSGGYIAITFAISRLEN